jgi:DNA-binding NarL/FixJ family response regulator
MLVEDHLSFRQSLALLLSREPDLEVVAQAGSLSASCIGRMPTSPFWC